MEHHRIALEGPRTVITVNGIKVSNYTEDEPVPPRKFSFEATLGPRPNEGYIGLQNHCNKHIVFFKKIAVRPLKN